MQRPSDYHELLALCRDRQCEGGPPPSPGAPGHGARIPGTHVMRSLTLLAMLKQGICTHHRPIRRALMPRSPQLCHGFPSKMGVSCMHQSAGLAEGCCLACSVASARLGSSCPCTPSCAPSQRRPARQRSRRRLQATSGKPAAAPDACPKAWLRSVYA